MFFCWFGDNVIDDKYKNRQERDNVKDPIRKEWIDGNMIWEDPIQGHQYILKDPSSGSSDDFGLCIWDFTTGHRRNITVKLFDVLELDLQILWRII